NARVKHPVLFIHRRQCVLFAVRLCRFAPLTEQPIPVGVNREFDSDISVRRGAEILGQIRRIVDLCCRRVRHQNALTSSRSRTATPDTIAVTPHQNIEDHCPRNRAHRTKTGAQKASMENRNSATMTTALSISDSPQVDGRISIPRSRELWFPFSL